MEEDPKTSRGKTVKKPPPRRKTTVKQRYVFVKEIKRDRIYRDYFDADPEVEKRLLGLEDLVCLFVLSQGLRG